MDSRYEQFHQWCEEGIMTSESILDAFTNRDPDIYDIEYNVPIVRRIAEAKPLAKRAVNDRARFSELMRRVRPYLQLVSSFAHAGLSQSKTEFLDLRRIHVPRLAEISSELNKLWSSDDIGDGVPPNSMNRATSGLETASVRAVDAKVHALMLAQESLRARSEIAFKVLEDELIPLRDRYEEELFFYENTKESLRSKVKDLDALLRDASERVLADNYADQATEEARSANLLRYGALAVMGIMVAIVSYSFFESTKGALSLHDALLRFGFIMVLSIPAAYLARESTKHRHQQYSLQQTALEVGTIDPYIASLPAEIQNQIKHETASKLFSPKTFGHLHDNIYPMNTQELLMKIADVLGSIRKSEDDGKDSRQKPVE